MIVEYIQIKTLWYIMIMFCWIIEGDSETALDLIKEPVQLVFTSPPYFTMRFSLKAEDKPDFIKEWEDSDVYRAYEGYLDKMKRIFQKIYKVLEEGRVFACNIGDYREQGIKFPIPADFIRICRDIGFTYEDDIIWYKGDAMEGLKACKRAGNFIKHGFPLYYRPDNTYEHVLIFRKGNIDYDRYNKEYKIDYVNYRDYLKDLWHIPPVPRNKPLTHPSGFPEKLVEMVVTFYSLPGETVLDPFAGAGTTNKVALSTGRNTIAIEIDPEWIEVIKRKVGFGQKNLVGSMEWRFSVSGQGSNYSTENSEQGDNQSPEPVT